MPYLAWRAIRVGLWTAFCTVGALYLWQKAQVPLNPVANQVVLSPKSGRFGTVNLCLCMFATPSEAASPASGILLIRHATGNWVVSLPDLQLVEPGATGPGLAVNQPPFFQKTPLTEAELTRVITGSQWPSRDAEFTADMDELWELVRSSPNGILSTRVRRFSVVHAEPWQRPAWARWRIGPVVLVMLWAAVAVVLWQIGSESPGERALAEAVATERSRMKRFGHWRARA